MFWFFQDFTLSSEIYISVVINSFKKNSKGNSLYHKLRALRFPQIENLFSQIINLSHELDNSFSYGFAVCSSI